MARQRLTTQQRRAELALEYWDNYRKAGALPIHLIVAGLHLPYRTVRAAIKRGDIPSVVVAGEEDICIPFDAAMRLHAQTYPQVG